jgi:hypothetical protein
MAANSHARETRANGCGDLRRNVFGIAGMVGRAHLMIAINPNMCWVSCRTAGIFGATVKLTFISSADLLI